MRVGRSDFNQRLDMFELTDRDMKLAVAVNKRLINKIKKDLMDATNYMEETHNLWDEFCLLNQGYEHMHHEIYEETIRDYINGTIDELLEDKQLSKIELAALWRITDGHDEYVENGSDDGIGYCTTDIVDHLYEELSQKARWHSNKRIRQAIDKQHGY